MNGTAGVPVSHALPWQGALLAVVVLAVLLAITLAASAWLTLRPDRRISHGGS